MNRSRLLAAGAAATLAACSRTASGLLVPGASSESRLAPCDKPLWKYPYNVLAKDGGVGYVDMMHKEGASCNWVQVGAINMDILIDKGGGYLKQDIGFSGKGYGSVTYQLSDLAYLYGPGSITQIFKRWYHQVSKDGKHGTLYDGPPSTGTILGTSKTDDSFSTTTLTWNVGSGAQYVANWGGVWGGGAPISGACIGAMIEEFGASCLWVSLIPGAAAGPLEWVGFAGATVLLFKSAANVAAKCPGS